MITQKDFLKFAFEEAINEVNPNSVDKDVAKATVETNIAKTATKAITFLRFLILKSSLKI